MGFLRCAGLAVVLGVSGFVLGRCLPKRWFRYDAPPFRSFAFEREGKIYEKLNIKKWQSKVPDMSRIFVHLMPAKKIRGRLDEATLTVMLRETCVAETIHWLLSAAGLGCLWLWPGWGGAAFYLVYVLLGNLPFILIQRYNRPRLAGLLRRIQERKTRTMED
ncbi:MAG: glycosyl-4,4'-diaponeurosporenoate acyltransferase [Candidatus Enterenecus sp.]